MANESGAPPMGSRGDATSGSSRTEAPKQLASPLVPRILDAPDLPFSARQHTTVTATVLAAARNASPA